MHGVEVVSADVWTSLDAIAVEAFQLLPQAPRRRIGGVLHQSKMQPLQPAVLLRQRDVWCGVLRLR